ncbi:DUF1501 domain-containing protein [Planctomyces sp. SH-PL62]|uniref:DUF1501 domain-containing protein n=1 Tax=Planctomyces sp. SH-PL62 TaxID=1636152 RepID=UPI00078BEA5B|nr:DUF1501 domain-containing protein [Planctomyces sp. SH-PL62]AMV40400.1 hypothetical protein VT85_23415 [Planctomyces sp. SH-PL62]
MHRREFLWQSGGGLGGLALAGLLGADGLLAADAVGGGLKLRPDGGLHHAPKAKRVVQLFMAGGASHVDLFDFKPDLIKLHGRPSSFGEKVETFQDGLGPWLRPIWDFKPYGRSGKMLSEVVAPLGAVVDDIAFIHNMVGKTGVHSQGTLLQTTGFNRPGFPSMGSWVSYGLGRLSDDLPSFVVLPDPRGLASNGSKNWDAAFLPSRCQGTVVNPGAKTPIADLFPDERVAFAGRAGDDAGVAILNRLNRAHADARPGDDRLEGRIQSYELAARMQLAAPEALDISNEPPEVLKLYGLDHIPSSFPAEINAEEETIVFGRRCLAARRLLERGVRFVQIWSGNDNGFPRRNWDSHENVEQDHGPLALGMARGASALIQDLKRTGLLEDTIVLWTTEFGRMPSSQGGKGRDHNPHCFTSWMVGGGVKPGVSYGPSDETGFKPIDREHPTEVYDLHATILHLLGVDHTRLTVRNNGVDRRLTDVHGHVITDLLA